MLKLLQLTEKEFEDFSRRSVVEYAESVSKSEAWAPPIALSNAALLFRQLLPDGQQTPNHHFLSIYAEDADCAVGNIWFQINKPEGSAFLFDIHIYPAYRGRGYASRALLLIESFVRELGLSTMRLHVFGHNGAARALYDKLGYSASHVAMTKRL